MELTIYYGGSAILTDADGASVWTSDGDDTEEFHEDFGESLSIDDADDLIDYLEAAGYIPEGMECDVVESDEIDDADADEEDDDEEDE